jgi:hypothetical protein
MTSCSKLTGSQAKSNDHDYDDYDDALDDDELDDTNVNDGDSSGSRTVADVQSSFTVRPASPHIQSDPIVGNKKKISAFEWVGYKVRRKAAIRRHRLLSVNSFKKYKIDWSVSILYSKQNNKIICLHEAVKAHFS